jgi:hypothetical protein
MANAGLQDRTQALMWENFAMIPIKTMMKSNYLQMTPKGTKYNRTEERTVNIDPVALRAAQSEFEVGDGLLPTQRLARTDVMTQGFQYLSSDPDIRAGYNIAPMFSYMMKVQGVDKLSKFEKAPEQVQYEQALRAWQSTAVEYSKLIGKQKAQDGTVFTPEDIAKVIGPMPQPPQQQKALPNPNARPQT